VINCVQSQHPIPPFSKESGECQLSHGIERDKNGVYWMTSAENAMYIDDNSWEYNSKPRFDKIVDHPHVIYSWEAKWGMRGVCFADCDPPITCYEHTVPCTRINYTLEYFMVREEIPNLRLWELYGNTFQVIHSTHEVTISCIRHSNRSTYSTMFAN